MHYLLESIPGRSLWSRDDWNGSPCFAENRKQETNTEEQRKEGEGSKSHRALLTVGNLGFIQKELRAMQGPRNCYDLRFPWS